MTLLTVYETPTVISHVLESHTITLALEQPLKEETGETPEQHAQKILVARALQGDKEAFDDIVKNYSTIMLRTAYMILGDRDIAEDAVQDAFIQAWQHLPNLREAGALRPWLMRIVV